MLTIVTPIMVKAKNFGSHAGISPTCCGDPDRRISDGLEGLPRWRHNRLGLPVRTGE